MNLKYFLRGLGIGIVGTVIIFNVFGNKPEKEVLTDAEIIERAQTLGMVMEDKKIEETLEQILNNQEQAKQQEEQRKAEEKEEKEKNLEEQENKEQQSFLPDPLVEEESTVISTITITKGMGSTQTAKALEKVGVIEDAEAFNEYLCETGNSVKLRIGTYQIKGRPSYAELAKIITKRQ